MHQTYELYLEFGAGERRFEALTCLANELIARVRQRLAETGAMACEVHQFGRRLFSLAG